MSSRQTKQIGYILWALLHHVVQSLLGDYEEKTLITQRK